MNKLLAFFLLLLAPAAADAQTAVQWGNNSGTVCAYDTSAARPCVTVGTLNPATHTFTLTAPATLSAPTSIPTTATVGTGTIAASMGTLLNGHCVSINSVGQFVDAGGACTTGGGGGTVSSGTSGQLANYTGSTAVGSFALAGDCTFSTPNITCTKTSGSAFAASATTDATNASNISSGTLAVGQLPAFAGGDCTSSAGSSALTCTKLNGVSASLGGTFTTAGAFSTSGAYAIVLMATGATNVTLPTSGTLATTTGVASSIGAALPSATASQLYGGTGAAGAAADVSLSGAAIVLQKLSPTLRGALGGLSLSNDGGSPNTTVDITTGAATSDDYSTYMSLPSAYTKTTGSWAVGSGNGALDAGSVAASTWYHVFLIERVDTGVVDILLSTNATSPILPTSYTKQRRVGSVKTDASSHILAFSQNGDEFLWLVPPNDINTAALGTTATLFTLSTPLGVKTNALLQGFVQAGTSANVLINSPDATSVGASATAVTFIAWSPSVGASGYVSTRTNTSSQIRAVSSAASTTAVFSTYGWVDTRGQNN
jgi:hypothetical protein